MADSGSGVLGEGQPAPPHQLEGLWERCKLPQQGPGRSPGRRRVFLYSVPSDCLSHAAFLTFPASQYVLHTVCMARYY